MQRAPGSTPAPVEPDKAERPRYRVHPDDMVDMRAAIADIAAGRTVDLTPDEVDEWARTGELPASVEARIAALECSEPQD